MLSKQKCSVIVVYVILFFTFRFGDLSVHIAFCIAFSIVMLIFGLYFAKNTTKKHNEVIDVFICKDGIYFDNIKVKWKDFRGFKKDAIG